MTAHLDHNACCSTVSLHFSHFLFRSAHKSTLYYLLPSTNTARGLQFFCMDGVDCLCVRRRKALSRSTISCLKGQFRPLICRRSNRGKHYRRLRYASFSCIYILSSEAKPSHGLRSRLRSDIKNFKLFLRTNAMPV